MSIHFRVPHPMAKNGTHTPYGGQKKVNSIFRSPPMAKHGTHTPCGGQNHVNLISRVRHIAKYGMQTPYGGQKHVNSISRDPSLQKMVRTLHIEVRNLSPQFRVPPNGVWVPCFAMGGGGAREIELKGFTPSYGVWVPFFPMLGGGGGNAKLN